MSSDETPAASLTFRTFVGAFVDFFIVAIHTVLYERRIYPQTAFLITKKYEFAVRQCRHPKVCEWINDAASAVENELVKGAAERVAIVIYNKENVPQERFVFDVSRFLTISPADVDATLERRSVNGTEIPVLPLVDLEEQLRGTMNRLANCSSVLKPLPKGCMFTVAIELKADAEAPLEHPQPWAPTLPRSVKEAPTAAEKTQIKPISAVSAGDMLFDMWVEEVAVVPTFQAKEKTND